jgi:hypothetical protein
MEEKTRKRKEREEENDFLAERNFRRFRCYRFGTKEPDRPQDDSGLCPEGTSDAEVQCALLSCGSLISPKTNVPFQPDTTWSEDCNWDGTALRVVSLVVEDFAGRYEVRSVIENGSVGTPQQGRAYVEITQSGIPSPYAHNVRHVANW